jgi:hypothetical protein
MTFSPFNTVGPFLPINQTFSEDDDQFLIQITNRDRDIARYLNVREIAIFDLVETPTGQQWYNLTNPQIKRNGFREVFAFTAIAAGATLTITHGIVGIVQVTNYWANVTTAVPDFRQVPYTDVATITNQIQMTVTPTTIVIINGVTAPAIVSGEATLEYLKN